jgi:hypothetical protein
MRHVRGPAGIAAVILGAAPLMLASFAVSDEPPAKPAASPPAETASTSTPEVEKRLYVGRVVRLSEALKKRGVEFAPEMDSHVVLETAQGELLPILADWRGRAFYQDERLRNRPVELVAHRRADVGYLQVLMVFTFDDQGDEQVTDYWCDICAIPMYELKPCECCQGDIRLRHQPQKPPADVVHYGGQKQVSR